MIRERTHKKRIANDWTAAIVDAAAVVLALVGFSTLAAQLLIPSGQNALLLVVVYSLFCIGVYLIRKLEPGTGEGGWSPPDFLVDPRTRGVLGFLFGLMMVTMVAHQLGYFSSVLTVQSAVLDEGDSSSLLVYMPGALLGFSMLYILILAFPVNESIGWSGKRANVFAASGLVFVDSMLLLGAAQAKALLMGSEGYLGPIMMLVFLLVLLILFAPPRILYQSKNTKPANVISALLLFIVISWLVIV